MSDSSPNTWAVQRRLEEIDSRLYWTGSVGRTDLIQRFGISPQQASADLKLYLAEAGETIRFDRSIRRYVPTESFRPICITASVESYIVWAGGAGCAPSNVPFPLRNADPQTLRALTTAIHQRRSVQIRYRSLTSPAGTVRRITPHSMIFTGTRYHVRAFCHHREDFRDFVLGRITEADSLGPPGRDKVADEAWNTLLVARIGPHPGLSADQRSVIETDYAMTDGEAQVTIKQALLLYLLDQFHLDGQEVARPAMEQQIVLLNPEIRRLAK